MAPEILAGVEITAKSDIWSLGITLIEVLDGAPPLSDIPPINVITVIPERPAPTLSGQYSKGLKAFLARMLEKDPKQRRSADRLMKHPFVKEEVSKALSGDNQILKKVAEECFETVQSLRDEIVKDEVDLGDVVTEEDEDLSDSEPTSDEDDGPMFIKKGVGLKPKNKEKKTSFASVLMDEEELQRHAEEEEAARIARKLKQKATRHTRGTQIKGVKRTKSIFSQTRNPSLMQSNDKLNAILQKNNLEFNLNDLKTERKNAKQDKLHGKEREDTVKKAEQLLSKIQALTNKKQL